MHPSKYRGPKGCPSPLPALLGLSPGSPASKALKQAGAWEPLWAVSGRCWEPLCAHWPSPASLGAAFHTHTPQLSLGWPPGSEHSWVSEEDADTTRSGGPAAVLTGAATERTHHSLSQAPTRGRAHANAHGQVQADPRRRPRCEPRHNATSRYAKRTLQTCVGTPACTHTLAHQVTPKHTHACPRVTHRQMHRHPGHSDRHTPDVYTHTHRVTETGTHLHPGH